MKNETHRLWPLISGTQFSDFDIIDYDDLFFNNYNNLIQQFEYQVNSNNNIIIDKSCEHLHDDHPNNIKKLNTLLDTYNCKHRCIVFDNTYNESIYKKQNIKHINAPFYIYFYLAKNNLKIPKWNPSVDNLFVCLNNTHKPHRQKFVELLHVNKILEKTKWSYRQSIKSNIIQTPKFLDQDGGDFDQSLNLESLYNDTLIALVTETDFYTKNITHVTEKSLWSIFYGCIPIIVGVPYSIKLLRSWGIDTYDDIVDQTYDNELDNNKRLEMIINSCVYLLSERYPERIKNLLPARVLRNQLLLSNKEYWQNQIKRILWDYKY